MTLTLYHQVTPKISDVLGEMKLFWKVWWPKSCAIHNDISSVHLNHHPTSELMNNLNMANLLILCINDCSTVDVKPKFNVMVKSLIHACFSI